MNLDEVMHTFIAESRELLQEMEDALLCIEQSPDDKELINAIFRAAHTIKGSAGLFGLDYIVAFTHVAESVLDKVRNGELHMESKLVAVLLSSCDHIGKLIEHLASGGGDPTAELQQASDAITAALNDFLGRVPAKNTQVAVLNEDKQACASAGDAAATDLWQISLRFGRDALRNGMDPLPFIRYLSTLGEIEQIVTLLDGIPALAEMDPESCYLGFEIGFRSDAEKAAIESVFDFVREDCSIRILPPHSKITDYLKLIAELPEEDLRVGEMLLRCGTLTVTELDAALTLQRSDGQGVPPLLGEVLVEEKIVQPQVMEAALEKQKQANEHKSSEGKLIRVDADKLDKLINLVGELIIVGAGTNLIAKRERYVKIFESTATVSRLVEEVRDSALSLRMVQIGATFNRFQRVVHDISREIGKDIELVISGAETELDKTVVEKIGDPLTHLVRNCMDHGIESAELRSACGKPPKGTLRLNAFHDSGSIVIEVSDDGGGLNRERILKKAIERGMVKADQQLSDREIYNLIFEPGLSTVEKVSNLSGRGVGMDVVRRNISALRGTVEIDSTEGVGTTMRVRLPLTLAIIDGFLVGVNGSSFVVPLDMVVECVELSQQESAASKGCDHLNLRGEVLPYIRLKQLFDISELLATMDAEAGDESEVAGEDSYEESSTSMLTAEGRAALANDPELAFLLHPVKRENVVVVQYAGHRAGLVVDDLLGEFQTVIRPLGLVFNGLDGVSGFTILGSGNVALILDVPGLVRRVTGNESSRITPAKTCITAE